MQTFLSNIKNISLGCLTLSVIVLLITKCNSDKKISELENKDKFISTLSDTIKTYKDKNNKNVFEKNTLIADLGLAKKYSNKLSYDYKSLLNEYKENKNTIVALNFKITTLKKEINNNKPKIDTIDNNIIFEDSSVTKDNVDTTFKSKLKYKITIKNIKQLSDTTKKPSLTIDYISMDDKIKVVIDKDKNNDIKTKITPTDTTTKVNDINSTINPDVIEKPKSNKLKLILVSGGVGVVIGWVSLVLILL